MMDNVNLAEQRKEFQNKKKLVFQLRATVTTLNSQKEEIYRQLKSISDKVKNRTSKIRELKDKRDSLTQEVRELKRTREVLNKAVKETALAKRSVEEKKQEFSGRLGHGKFDRKETPGRLNAQIEQLETKLETEVLPFDKE